MKLVRKLLEKKVLTITIIGFIFSALSLILFSKILTKIVQLLVLLKKKKIWIYLLRKGQLVLKFQ